VDWCAQRLAKFKIPRYIEYINSLPKTTTFKVKKIVLINEKPDLTVGHGTGLQARPEFSCYLIEDM